MVFREMSGVGDNSGGRYGSVGESGGGTSTTDPTDGGPSEGAPALSLCEVMSSSRVSLTNGLPCQSFSNSGSSSSRSSVVIDDPSEAGFHAPGDTYQWQPLISGESYAPNGSYYKDSQRSYTNGSGPSNGMVRINIPNSARQEPRFPKEKLKTLLAFIFLFCNWIFTTVSLAFTHEKVPNAPPLPDVILDNVNPHAWGLEASEIMIIVSVYACIVVIIFHKHRFIIFRRIFVILGLLYFYRSITMYVTVLPVADPNYYCSPKANTTTALIVVKRVLRLLSGFGLSMNGQHTYCGDYIYSGHTVCLVMAYLVIREYTPKRWWLLHWLFVFFAAFGVVMVLIARGHYTVDCLIAYYITTRLFYIYHTLTLNPPLKENGPHNFFERLWWFSLFQYFEKNVHGTVPRHYEWPLPWPRRWCAKNPQRTS